MTKFEELLADVAEKGIDEESVIRWFAFSDIEGIRDLDDKELVDYMLHPFIYNKENLTTYWEELGDEGRKDYRMYLLDFYDKAPKPVYHYQVLVVLSELTVDALGNVDHVKILEEEESNEASLFTDGTSLEAAKTFFDLLTK